MLLRKPPLKWVETGRKSIVTDGYDYEVTRNSSPETTPMFTLWVQTGEWECLGQFPSMEAAKQAAEEHWTAVVPPGCERVEICEECDGGGYWGVGSKPCPDCQGSGVVPVEAKP